jgi:hypothetical protein
MTGKDQKFFPIRTETSCKLKWSWTTLYLNWGVSATCHRTAHHPLTPENFNNFHNNPQAVEDRQRMLQGQWPEKNCSYCREIEESGGTSDRLRLINIPGWYPEELDADPLLVEVDPTFLEVYFNNTCNLGCLYCTPQLSSVIEQENRKFGGLKDLSFKLEFDQSDSGQYKNLIPSFWEWFPTGFPKLKRLHILGGEPFYQQELDQLLEYIDQHPNPDCEFNIVSNLMVSYEKFESYIARIKQLVIKRKIKRFDITCSIDCWGPEQEYVRWGLNLSTWEKNFSLLLKNRWIYLNINQTISALTIKTMPDLLIKLQEWRKGRKVGHWFSEVSPGPSYMKAEIFGRQEFVESSESILKLMPRESAEDQSAYEYMAGIFNHMHKIENPDYAEIKKLLTFLNEKDRRRNTNWEKLFPWLVKYKDLCGITK